jgi:hypothetical protein
MVLVVVPRDGVRLPVHALVQHEERREPHAARLPLHLGGVRVAHALQPRRLTLQGGPVRRRGTLRYQGEGGPDAVPRRPSVAAHVVAFGVAAVGGSTGFSNFLRQFMANSLNYGKVSQASKNLKLRSQWSSRYL